MACAAGPCAEGRGLRVRHRLRLRHGSRHRGAIVEARLPRVHGLLSADIDQRFVEQHSTVSSCIFTISTTSLSLSLCVDITDKNNPKQTPISIDVTKDDSVKEAVAQVEKALKDTSKYPVGLIGIVNCAGS